MRDSRGYSIQQNPMDGFVRRGMIEPTGGDLFGNLKRDFCFNLTDQQKRKCRRQETQCTYVPYYVVWTKRKELAVWLIRCGAAEFYTDTWWPEQLGTQ